MKLTPGDHICVLVNGQPVETVIDEHGTQRFIENEVVSWLLYNGRLDMNAMALAFHDGQFSLEAYMEFYMSIGYTPGGFEEVFGEGSSIAEHTGQPCEILNPIWDGTGETIH